MSAELAGAPPATVDREPPATFTRTSPLGYALHVGLFLATLATTTLQGALDTGTLPASGGALLGWLSRGLRFSLPLLAILLAHEFGHYVAARRHGVDASLPYFIPVPIIGVGTFGAFMRIRSPIPSRKALLDIGIAGPLAGLVVAIPVLVIGLSLSAVVVQQPAPEQIIKQEGQSLLYGLLKLAILGEWVPVTTAQGIRDVVLHPMAFAGWVGLLLTFMNLMPIAQLDGGHIFYAWVGERHRTITDWLHRALFALGLLVMAVVAYGARGRGIGSALAAGAEAGGFWLLFGALIAVLRRIGEPYHPPVPAEGPPDHLGRGRTALAVLALVLLVLLFMPAPMRRIFG